MSYTITRSEYLTIDGVPLSTPAWETLDLSELSNGADLRGEDYIIPQRRGAEARKRTTDSRIVNIPIIIFGDKSATNTVYGDTRSGLLQNIDALKNLIRPLNRSSSVGVTTKTLIWYKPNGNVTTQIHINPNIDITYINSYTARATLEITIPSGVLVSTTTTTINQYVDDDTTFNLAILGSGEVINYIINIPGASNNLEITSNTLGYSLEYNLPINNNIQINTGSYTALDNTTDISGNIITSGTNLWLPLIPGANNWTITRNGAATSLMTITYNAVYL